MEPRFFASPAELRAWLAEHHASVAELWIGFYKKGSGRGRITYPEALDEALCFGWIDGVRKTVDGDSYTNRFTPRKRGSNWSEVNIKRAHELIGLGRMQPPGLAAFEARDEAKTEQYSHEARTRGLDEPYEQMLRENPAAWEFFQAQPPGYRRLASWWVMSAKKEETRRKRLATLIEDSAAGRRIAGLSKPGKQE